MDQFFTGTIMMAYAVAGLCFLKFWRRTQDRLFAMFALAFWMLAANQIARISGSFANEGLPIYYVVRLIAYVVILSAIIDKNRPKT
jgi:hypothetical protein